MQGGTSMWAGGGNVVLETINVQAEQGGQQRATLLAHPQMCACTVARVPSAVTES
jgi:hypothetical protein